MAEIEAGLYRQIEEAHGAGEAVSVIVTVKRPGGIAAGAEPLRRLRERIEEQCGPAFVFVELGNGGMAAVTASAMYVATLVTDPEVKVARSAQRSARVMPPPGMTL